MFSPGTYARWRARGWAAHTLAELPPASPLTERMLQLIWQFQRLKRDDLVTVQGQPVRVLHPGFWNHEAGPDFRNAVIQIGPGLAHNGDVEIDLVPQGWHGHHHDTNPAYRHVILHAVWEADAPWAGHLPVLPLKACLDAPLEELTLWLRQDPAPAAPCLLGRCAASLRNLPESGVAQLLEQAAQVRLETKARHFQARARQVGWEQSLWEGLFSALGYKNNVWPMQQISRSLPALMAKCAEEVSLVQLQARLLGVSGLLPADADVRRAAGQAYLRRLWEFWWREQGHFDEFVLPKSMWRLNGLRPANQPQRRLALAAHWLGQFNLPGRLEKWFASAKPGPKLASSLWEALQTDEDQFWSRHWTFRSAAMGQPQPLIGPPRLTDLAMNVVLPWFWTRAEAGQNRELQKRAEACYFAWPKGQDNAVLRFVSRRLFGDDPRVRLDSAALQQGLLQIVRDFCEFSNALCENCPFPELVRSHC